MEFKDYVKTQGGVVILAGSNSDKDHIDELGKHLDSYSLKYEVRIASAHKQPEKIVDLIREYDSLEGKLAYVTVAGGTDALSGMVSFLSNRPTISSPPDAPNQSCVTNPPGSSNAYIPKPANVARFIAQMFSSDYPTYEAILTKKRIDKIARLEEADDKWTN